MKITRDNYEEFFLDYLDGNLDEDLYDPFIEFLQSNPDLKEELASLKTYSNEPENITFPGKAKLLKTKYDSQKEFDFASVALTEGDLPAEEEEQFRDYLSHRPEKLKEFELFKKTRLAADESVVFKAKAGIYKTHGVKRFIYLTGRIAAVLALFFSVTVLLKNYSEIDTPAERITRQLSEPVDMNEQASLAGQESEILPVPEATNAKVNNTAIKFSVAQTTAEKNKPAENFPERESEVLTELAAIHVTLNNPELPTTLATMNQANLDVTGIAGYSGEKPLLAEILKEKTGVPRISFSSIAKAGLKLVAGVSKNKFSYDTNDAGNVTEVNFESRLLAFTIPTSGNHIRE